MSEAAEPLLDLEARPDPYLGKVLAGRYRIVRLIGGGGMGAVYEAEHTLIGRRVAVKILYAQLASDAQVVKRFVNEARAAATIGHPHILECTDIGQADDGSPFLVLELLEGHDLEKDFEIHGPMPIGRLVMLLKQACSALAAAHDKGIVHRDIKPENIFLSIQKGVPDHVKVLDFGISKFNSMKSTGPGTMSGSAMGTPYYMSPEQFRDASNVDARADIYAMGIILYQGLAGRLPFMADNLPSLALEIATGTPPPLAAIRPDVPPALVEVIERTMKRNPAERFQTMAELSDAIAPFASIDAPVDVRDVPVTMSIAHLDTAAAIDVTGKNSHIRVKGDDERRGTSPVMAVGLLLALLGGGAGVYAALRPQPAPAPAALPSPVVVAAPPPPAPAPAPAVAEPTKHTIHIESNVAGATAHVRGRTVPLPYDDTVEESSTPEIIDVAAEGRTTVRYALTLDRPRTLFATLERGSGQQFASDTQLALALTGQPSPAADADRPSGGSTSPRPVGTTAAPAAMASEPAAAMEAAMTSSPRPVYTGPSGDLPEL